MRDLRRTAAVIVVAVTALGRASLAPAQEPTQEPRKITVTAKKYEFNPSSIELKVGEPVEITFVSQDAKHGFVCKELNLEKVVFNKDQSATVSFTPDKAGTFKFKCANFCGFGHPGMKGKFVVSP